MAAFRGNRNIHYFKSKEGDLTGKAWTYLISKTDKDKSQLCNSMELPEFYWKQDGSSLSRKQLMKKLLEHYGSDVIILFSCGVDNLFILKSTAPSFLKLVSIDDDDDDIEH